MNAPDTTIRPVSSHPERDWPCDTPTCTVVTNDLRSFTKIGSQFFCAACAAKELLA